MDSRPTLGGKQSSGMSGLYNIPKPMPSFEDIKKEDLPGLDSILDKPAGGKNGKKKKGGNRGDIGGKVLKTGFFWGKLLISKVYKWFKSKVDWHEL